MIYQIIILFYILLTNYIKYLIYKNKRDEILINTFKQLGDFNIIFVKVFQWLTFDKRIENNLISENVGLFLKKYTNNTPYNDEDINYKLLCNCYILAKENNLNLEIENIKPINSGSIALIFKGKINGKSIIIKMLRNNIKKKIDEGIYLLLLISRILDYVPNLNHINIKSVLIENINNFKNQIDFNQESNNIENFYNRCSSYKNIIIPNTYNIFNDKYKDIIIMDYFEGKYLNEMTNEEKKLFILPFIKMIKKTIFLKNIFHGDLHPGNLLLIKEYKNDKEIYKIGLIDFGMIINLNVKETDFVYMMLDLVFNNNTDNFINHVKDLENLVFKNFDINKINKFIEKFNYEVTTNKFFKYRYVIQVLPQLNLLLKYFKDYNLILNDNIYKIFLSFFPFINTLISMGVNGSRDIVQSEFDFFKID